MNTASPKSMTNQKMEYEEEALFRSYPYAVYFVQSPSTHSHANSSSNDLPNQNQETSRATLSHYSSSRGSNNSDKKSVVSVHVQNHLRICDILENEKHDKEDEDEYEEYYGNWRRMGWWKYFSFRHSSSCLWICLQIVLRLLLSLGFAMLVFYLATKPPPPKLSLKMAGVKEFVLGEGVDASGVTTKILNCNFSMQLLVDNNSKLFGLHIQPPLLSISFANLPFATSLGKVVYAYSDGITSFQLNIGTENKPMYGAGRSMEDMLESGKGLPLSIHMNFISSFRVISSFIKPTFHHQGQCLLVLKTSDDKKHRTISYKSNCIIHH